MKTKRGQCTQGTGHVVIANRGVEHREAVMAKARKKKRKTKSTSLVKYGDYTLDDANEEQEDLDGSRGGVILRWKAGRNVGRFIPPLIGKKWRLRIYEHFIDIPGVGRVSFVCPRLVAKEFCPPCHKRDQMLRSGNKVDIKRSSGLKPKRRSYANWINRKDEEAGPRVIVFGPQIEEQLIELRKDPDEGGNFVNPINGFDIVIRKKGELLNTEYKVMPANKGRTCPLHEDTVMMNQWIENQHALERFGAVLTADQIEAKLRGEEVDDEDEGDSRRSKKRKKPKKTLDEELDELEDADWEDYEEEDDDEEYEEDEEE